MSIDRAQLLTDVLTVINGATGSVATLRDAGKIRYEGPYDPPDPSGDAAAPTEFLDLILAESGAGGEAFGNQMVEGNIEFGIWQEKRPGYDRRGRLLAQAVEEMFEGQDTATMMFYAEDAFIANEGDVDGAWWLKRLEIPYQRREAI